MKTFLNVLYRRILYKIPLKLLLVLLAVFGVLFVCFSSADSVDTLIHKICSDGTDNCVDTFSKSLTTSYSNIFNYDFQSDKTYCIRIKSSSAGDVKLTFGFSNTSNGTPSASFNYWPGWSSNNNYAYVCSIGWNYFKGMSATNTTIVGDMFELDNLLSSALPIYTSQQCQTEYNLIPVESVDSNYCQTNNLCPSCPVCPSVPVGSGGYSQLYINNILHLGAPNIIMNIPDEIDWDYAYTQGGQNMNIDVVGYNVDYEKIDSIVQFQNYKPSSEDFQKIIGLLAPYTKIIVFFVFLFIVWAWIKKPFKSKKL